MGAMPMMMELILMASPCMSGLACPGMFCVAIMLMSLMMVRRTFCRGHFSMDLMQSMALYHSFHRSTA